MAQTSAQKARAARIAKIERAVVVISVVVGLGAAGVIWKNHHQGTGGTDPTVKALRDIGVTPFVACGMAQPTTDVPVQYEIVGPGQTASPTMPPSASPQPGDEIVPPGQKVHYSTVPPSTGPHLATSPVAVNAAVLLHRGPTGRRWRGWWPI